MFSIIKWDFIDFGKRNAWVFIGMLASLILAILPTSGVGLLNNFLLCLSALLGFIFFQAGIVIAIGHCFRWLEGPTSSLELSLPSSSWSRIISKLVTALLVNFISCIFILQLFIMLSNVSAGSLKSITGQNLVGILGCILFLSMIDATVQLSYVIAKSWRATRHILAMATTLISLVILITFTSLMIIVMSHYGGQIILPTISFDSILTVNGTLQILSSDIPVWTCLITVFIESLLSSSLLDKHFQAD